MRIQETLIAFIFGIMILAALLTGHRSKERYFPLQEWVGKDELYLDSPGNIWIQSETGMEFVWIKGGCFNMGCIDDTRQCNPNEYPVHEVCLDSFWIGRYPVTQNHWLQIFETNPSYFQENAAHPVENISWHDARKYINELNQREGREIFRLPTEAEWEYACRNIEKQTNFSGSMDPDEVAWHRGNSGGSTREVGARMPNEFGLFDMSGNVFEWVQDVYDEKAYLRHTLHNPIVDTGLGPAYDPYLSLMEPYIRGDSLRVIRGGSWQHPPKAARCSNRNFMAAGSRKNYIGFRIASDLPDSNDIENIE
jgi:formylglycine-generating enzyme required for sulfatase activity